MHLRQSNLSLFEKRDLYGFGAMIGADEIESGHPSKNNILSMFARFNP
jgi:hypothetical protein